MAKITNRGLAALGRIYRTDSPIQAPGVIDFATPVQCVHDVSREVERGIGTEIVINRQLTLGVAGDIYAELTDAAFRAAVDTGDRELWVIRVGARAVDANAGLLRVGVLDGSILGYPTDPWQSWHPLYRVPSWEQVYAGANYQPSAITFEVARPLLLHRGWVAKFMFTAAGASNAYVSLYCQLLPAGATPAGLP